MKTKLIDLAQEIREGQPVHGNHHKTYAFQNTTFEKTRRLCRVPFQSGNLLINEHRPTHVDAHAELVPHRKTIDQEPLERFYTSAACLDVSHLKPRSFMTKAILQEALNKSGLDIRKGDTVLLYTGTYDKNKDDPEAYLNERPGLDREASLWLADIGVVVVGIDAASVDSPADPNLSCHAVCREQTPRPESRSGISNEADTCRRETIASVPEHIENVFTML